MQKKYKLIACDLDGTLLNDNLQISENNKLAISELAKKGVYFVPSTGRTISEFKEIVNHKDIRYIIHSTGAVVLDKKTNTRIMNCLSKEMTKEIMDVLCTYKPFYVVHCQGKLYGDMADKNPDDYSIGYAVKYLLTNIAINKKNFESEIYKMENIESLCVFFKSQSDADDCKNTFANMADRHCNCVECCTFVFNYDSTGFFNKIFNVFIIGIPFNSVFVGRAFFIFIYGDV